MNAASCRWREGERERGWFGGRERGREWAKYLGVVAAAEAATTAAAAVEVVLGVLGVMVVVVVCLRPPSKHARQL